MPKVNFDDYAADYQQLLGNQLRFFDTLDYFSEHKVKILHSQKIKNPKTILEYGCGIGRNLPFLQRFFPEASLYGCDISAKSLEKAAQENPSVNFFNHHETKSTLKFDLILVAGVLHHIETHQRVQILQELEQLLNPEGELFIFEHNPYNFVTRNRVKHCEFDEDAILLKPKELRSLLQETSLKLHALHYTLFIPSFLKALRGLEPYLRYIPLGGQYYIHASNRI